MPPTLLLSPQFKTDAPAMSCRMRQRVLARGGTQPSVKLPIQTPARSLLGAGARWAAAVQPTKDATIPAHRN
jgi:hypothetical protein